MFLINIIEQKSIKTFPLFTVCFGNVSELGKRKRVSFVETLYSIVWAHTDLNCGPPDYESGALTS